MAYCPRCGIETDNRRRNCPLCECFIPQIEELNNKVNSSNSENESMIKFPQPAGFSRGYFVDLKIIFFRAISLFILINILFLAGIQIKEMTINLFSIYLMFTLLSIWLYLLIFLGFIINKKLALFLLITNSIGFALLLDLFYSGLGWFFPVFFPVIILGSAILIISAIIIRVRKSKSLMIILYFVFAIAAFLTGTEIIVSNYIRKQIVLSWSLLISVELIILTLLFLFFYYKLPVKILDKLKKKMHI